jgi:hypothetical protein
MEGRQRGDQHSGGAVINEGNIMAAAKGGKVLEKILNIY